MSVTRELAAKATPTKNFIVGNIRYCDPVRRYSEDTVLSRNESGIGEEGREVVYVKSTVDLGIVVAW
jgi:hypothetical protein